ncbi:MAG: nuclear transport factor 2 family protein [Myxococcota bacterium]
MTIQATLTAQVEAWNRGDIPAFCAACTDDVVYVNRAGVHRGRASVQAAYEAAYPDRASMGTLSLVVRSEEVRGDTAIAVVDWSVGDRGGHALLVLRRTDAGWLLAYDATV